MRDDAIAAVAWVRGRLPALTSGRVLDVGCGEGTFLPGGAVGVDPDAARLAAARARSRFVVRADARSLPFADRAFDTVFAHRMLNDTGDVDRALGEIARVLRDGGTLLVFTRARPLGTQSEPLGTQSEPLGAQSEPLGAQTEAKTRSSTQALGRASPDRASELDRLDRWNGAERIARHFAHVRAETTDEDDRAALFVATGPHR